MSITVRDNTIKVKEAMADAVSAFLEEASGELEAQTKRKSRVKTSQTKGSYHHKVEMKPTEGTGYIGSDEQNAIWEEFGTGEYALNGDGRKGYWVYVEGGSSGSKVSTGKTYTLEEAKKVMAILRSKGLEAYYTKGKSANRPMYKAFTENEKKIQNRLQEILKKELS